MVIFCCLFSFLVLFWIYRIDRAHWLAQLKIMSKIKSLYLCYILFVWKTFISLSLLKDNFAKYRILDWWGFFPFSNLSISLHCLLAHMVSEEKSNVVIFFLHKCGVFVIWLLSGFFLYL